MNKDEDEGAYKPSLARQRPVYPSSWAFPRRDEEAKRTQGLQQQPLKDCDVHVRQQRDQSGQQ